MGDLSVFIEALYKALRASPGNPGEPVTATATRIMA
jgi:hypothetical protein